MSFLSIAHTDVGIKKSTNQDSVLIKEASTDYGRVLLAVICDGMGGLAKGEVASATLVRAFSEWFQNEFPSVLYEDSKEGVIDFDVLQLNWSRLIDLTNQKIAAYGESFHAPCGTTLAALLLMNGHYYVANVGDSRVYRMNEKFYQITKDQTFVQREIDEGRMTEEEAKNHPQRNVLLQCVGASDVVVPDFFEGTYHSGDVFMSCSDGFRHLITDEEFMKVINPTQINDEQSMKNAAIYCTELNKQRKENDNISVLLIKTI